MSLCPFHPSLRARCTLCQIQEPFLVFSFQLGELNRKLFLWYRNLEHILKTSEILQFTLVWQISYFESSFHGTPLLFQSVPLVLIPLNSKMSLIKSYTMEWGTIFPPAANFSLQLISRLGWNCSSELLQRARLRFVCGCLMQFDILEKEEWEVVIIHYVPGTFQRKKQLLPNTKRCLSWSQTRRKQDHLLALWDCCSDDVVSRKTGICMAEEVQLVPWVFHGLAELFWTMIHCPFSWQKINFPVLERNMYIYIYIYTF